MYLWYIVFLRHRICERGIFPNPAKLKAINELHPLKDVYEVRRFLGMTGYYRRFVRNYAQISDAMVKLTTKGVDFKWDKEENESFNALKQALMNNATVVHFDPNRKLLLKTDASTIGVEGILFQ